MALPSPGPRTAALVTGASSGLGVEFARVLASRGYHLVLVARRTDRLRTLADELSSQHNIQAHPVGADLSDEHSIRSMLDEVDGLPLDIEILVNNAGLGATGAFQNVELATHERVVRVNIAATVTLCGALLPAMLSRGQGAVLNVGSITGFQPLPGNGTYAASKAFILSFTETLHAELSGTGVTATAVCPGPVKTELYEVSGASDLADGVPSFAWTTPEFVAQEGIEGLNAGRRVVIPGITNRISAIYGQHVPRWMLLRVVTPLVERFGPNVH